MTKVRSYSVTILSDEPPSKGSTGRGCPQSKLVLWVILSIVTCGLASLIYLIWLLLEKRVPDHCSIHERMKEDRSTETPIMVLTSSTETESLMKNLLGRIGGCPQLHYMDIHEYASDDFVEHYDISGTENDGEFDAENAYIIKNASSTALIGAEAADRHDTIDTDHDASYINVGGNAVGNAVDAIVSLGDAHGGGTKICNNSEIGQVNTDAVGTSENTADMPDNVYERDVICSFSWTERGNFFGSEANPYPLRKVLQKTGSMNVRILMIMVNHKESDNRQISRHDDWDGIFAEACKIYRKHWKHHGSSEECEQVELLTINRKFNKIQKKKLLNFLTH